MIFNYTLLVINFYTLHLTTSELLVYRNENQYVYTQKNCWLTKNFNSYKLQYHGQKNLIDVLVCVCVYIYIYIYIVQIQLLMDMVAQLYYECLLLLN